MEIDSNTNSGKKKIKISENDYTYVDISMFENYPIIKEEETKSEEFIKEKN